SVKRLPSSRCRSSRLLTGRRSLQVLTVTKTHYATYGSKQPNSKHHSKYSTPYRQQQHHRNHKSKGATNVYRRHDYANHLCHDHPAIWDDHDRSSSVIEE